jgi:hypothetical protein
MAGSGDESAASSGHRSRLRASDADRDQVAEVIKAAFVQGRLSNDEFHLRINRVYASWTYADLDALTADIPAGLTKARLPGDASELDSKKRIQRGTAVGAVASLVLSTAMVIMSKHPIVGLIAVPLFSSFATVLIAGLLTILSWALEVSRGLVVVRLPFVLSFWRRVGPHALWGRARGYRPRR